MLLPRLLYIERPMNIHLLGVCHGSAPRKVICLTCCTTPSRRQPSSSGRRTNPDRFVGLQIVPMTMMDVVIWIKRWTIKLSIYM